MNLKNVISQANDDGWYIKEDFVNNETQDLSYNNFLKQLLNTDQATWGCPISLQDGKAKAKNASLKTPIVLQLTNLTNVTAPKANQESSAAPRLLKLTLTDGKNFWNGLEVNEIKSLSLKTTPGSKIKLIGTVPIINGYLLLTSANTQYLGGVVVEMFEKWKLSQSVSKYNRIITLNSSSPPPWVPFGKAIIVNKDKNFKSLESKLVDEKFENERKAVVHALTGGESKKKFGGGKQLLDSNVQKVVDAGFTIADAEWALKKNRNESHRAIKALKVANGMIEISDSDADFSSRGNRRGRGRRGKFGRKKGLDDSDEENDYDTSFASRPTGPVSLVDFLENRVFGKSGEDLESGYKPPEKSYGRSNYEDRKRNQPRGSRRGASRSFDKYTRKSQYDKEKKEENNLLEENFWPSLGQEVSETPKQETIIKSQILSNSKPDKKHSSYYYDEEEYYEYSQDYYDNKSSYGTQASSYGNKSSYGTQASSYGNKSSYGTPASSYGNKSSYGTQASNYGNKSSYGTQASSYGIKSSYGTEDPSYGKKSSYGTQDPSYGNKSSYGTQDPSYGNKSSYGTQDPSYGNKSSYGTQDPSYGNKSSYGTQDPSYGNKSSYGTQASSYDNKSTGNRHYKTNEKFSQNYKSDNSSPYNNQKQRSYNNSTQSEAFNYDKETYHKRSSNDKLTSKQHSDNEKKLIEEFKKSMVISGDYDVPTNKDNDYDANSYNDQAYGYYSQSSYPSNNSSRGSRRRGRGQRSYSKYN